ncbi:MAG TPA: sulfotransferase [Xanthomonadales bacterium]|nr:sulfotransferase [Xanthomonadales bacterium]
MNSSMQADRPGIAGLPDFDRLFDRPVIILAAPRSGSTLLFETLAECANVWTIGGESHQVIESIPALNPASGRIDSNRLTAAHANPPVDELMRRRFARLLRDRDGREFFRLRHLSQLRFLEKTPKNALRLPFLNRIFPDALYIFLFRDVRANLSSMMEAWRSTRWKTYPRLSGWQGPPWSLLLPPGWQKLNGKTIAEICAYQWQSANQTVLDDLRELPDHRWISVSYESLLNDQAACVKRLCEFAGFEMDERLRSRLAEPLPLSRFTQTQPAADKWRKNEIEINPVLPGLEALESELSALGYRRQD